MVASLYTLLPSLCLLWAVWAWPSARTWPLCSLQESLQLLEHHLYYVSGQFPDIVNSKLTLQTHITAVGAGTIADIYPPSERGGAMAVYLMPVLLGPCIAPVLAGVCTEYIPNDFGWST